MKNWLIASLSLLALGSTASALTITPTFVDGEGFTWNADFRGVVNAAIGEWTSLIGDEQNIDVTLRFTTAGTDSYLAVWQGGIQAYAGADLYAWSPGVSHTIMVNTSHFGTANPLWFDPTPTTSNDIAFSHFDALSVMRHEIGHMLGFTDDFYKTNFGLSGAVDKWGSLISSGIFDPEGLHVVMDPDAAHISQSMGVMMSPALVNGTRQDISTTELAMLSRAYGYTIIPEPSTYGVCAAGALGAAVWRRRRQKAPRGA